MTEQAYVDGSIAGYLAKLASDEPEPGGGSVAALVGALGAGLVTMVTCLTLGREKFAAVESEMNELKDAAEKLRAELGELVTLDAEAYRAVAKAMKLPKDTEAQAAERNRILQAALKGAAETPLRVVERAVEVARLSLPAAEKGNPHAVSDAGVAVLLSDAAAQSAALNVRINMAWIDDQDYNKDIWARTETALAEAAQLREKVMALTYNKL